MQGRVKIALIGAGMFGGDVHLRAYADLQRDGLAPHFSRLGFNQWARTLAPLEFELCAIATRSAKSAQSAARNFANWTGFTPRTYSGDTPWQEVLRDFPDLDVLAVATPDDLHAEVILYALKHGVHVITEKPMCLTVAEADQIIRAAEHSGLIVAVDMHKRYDPDHRRIREDLTARIGSPLYGSAYLEEPLQVSTSTFQWVEKSDPFTYVGTHWVDLIWHYYHSKPVSLTAVGQKQRLLGQGIDAYDAVQVRVDYANGMSIYYHNNWITPADFEGPVNQGHEIVGVRGKVESDQQNRGLRYWEEGGGSHTANTHFTRDVAQPDGYLGRVGYGVDSIMAGVTAICRRKFEACKVGALEGLYPSAADVRVTTAILQAAAVVRDLNYKHTRQGRGAPVTARFGQDGIIILDPYAKGGGGKIAGRCIYNKSI